MADPSPSAHAATTVGRNLSEVRARVEAAARRARRDPKAVEIVAVTKQVDSATTGLCLRQGLIDLGEARIDALEAKAQALSSFHPAPRWHFVGHLQRNKARRVAALAHTLHSLDSLALLNALGRLSEELGRSLVCFIELRLSGESAKTGLDPRELHDLVRASAAHPRLALRGLMTMAPLIEGDETRRLEAARATFRELRRIASELERNPELAPRFQDGRVRTSMGMSDDFEIAIEEGSDCVRIGSALFAGLDDERNAA